MAHSTQTLTSPRSLWLVGSPQLPELVALREELEAVGYRVTLSAPTPQPDALWDRTPPSLVLIDLKDDPALAVELCGNLHADDNWQGTPILMLHDGQDSGALRRASEAGAQEFLERPFLPALLEHRLDGAIERTLRILQELPASETASILGGTDMEAFEERVERALEAVKKSDLCVAVLAVATSADGDLGIAPTLAQVLRRALASFENEGPISHPKGDVFFGRGDDGTHYLCMPDMARLQDAARLGYALQGELRQIKDPSGTGEAIDVCVGVANSPGDGTGALELHEAARGAAHAASQAGDSHLKFHNQATDRWVFERLTLERSLRRALEDRQFVLYYQPKVDAATRAIVGFEALLRWQHPELGMVSPAQFIPLAEETGLIVPIGEWVLETACRQNKAWQDAGFSPVRMSVNLSPEQFRLVELSETVDTVLKSTGLAPEYLELEVTESMLMHDIQDTIRTLTRFKDAGVYLSIDDFGTGYSSLSYLKGFPIDALKIDRSFISDITSNTDDAAIATSIILMGRSLNLQVIAEGVETESQLAFLQVLQCNEIQGYLISPPVPATEAETFLDRPED